MKKVCLGCGRLIPAGRLARCSDCLRVQDRERGTRQQRGYDRGHDMARAAIASMMPTACIYCGDLILVGQRWVAAHVVDGDPSAGWAAAHPACNERAKVRGYSGTGQVATLGPAAPRAHTYKGTHTP